MTTILTTSFAKGAHADAARLLEYIRRTHAQKNEPRLIPNADGTPYCWVQSFDSSIIPEAHIGITYGVAEDGTMGIPKLIVAAVQEVRGEENEPAGPAIAPGLPNWISFAQDGSWGYVFGSMGESAEIARFLEGADLPYPH